MTDDITQCKIKLQERTIVGHDKENKRNHNRSGERHTCENFIRAEI